MKRHSIGIGGVSLILIFSIVCLAVLTLVTLSSVNRDSRLTEKLKQSVENYYSADSAAIEVAAQLQTAAKSGSFPSEINQTQIQSEGNGIYTYNCPIDARRAIAVKLLLSKEACTIVSWAETGIENWRPEDQILVFGGE